MLHYLINNIDLINLKKLIDEISKISKEKILEIKFYKILYKIYYLIKFVKKLITRFQLKKLKIIFCCHFF